MDPVDLLREFADKHIKDWNGLYFRYVVNGSVEDVSISHKHKYPEDIPIDDSFRDEVAFILERQKADLEKLLESQSRLPKCGVLCVTRSGSRRQLEYDNEHALSIKRADIAKANSFFAEGSLALPPEVQEAQLARFAEGKKLDSVWELQGFDCQRDKVNVKTGFIGRVLLPLNVRKAAHWLLPSAAFEKLPKQKSAKGLRLSIFDDGTFLEQSENETGFGYFNREGCLIDEIIPFSGKVSIFKNRRFLLLDQPISWACPAEADEEFIRYDDGDTKISDEIKIVENNLIRTVAVITDGYLLDRFLYIYKRV